MTLYYKLCLDYLDCMLHMSFYYGTSSVNPIDLSTCYMFLSLNDNVLHHVLHVKGIQMTVYCVIYIIMYITLKSYILPSFAC